jgi:hypothetical protein
MWLLVVGALGVVVWWGLTHEAPPTYPPGPRPLSAAEQQTLAKLLTPRALTSQRTALLGPLDARPKGRYVVTDAAGRVVEVGSGRGRLTISHTVAHATVDLGGVAEEYRNGWLDSLNAWSDDYHPTKAKDAYPHWVRDEAMKLLR